MSYLEERRHQKQFGKQPKEKVFSKINAVSEKRKAEFAAQKESGTDAAMDRWHEDQRMMATGHCLFCGGATEKFNDKTYRNSNAHLFAKKKGQFPSIKTQPAVGIELCFFGNSCHTNFDTHMIGFEDIKRDWPGAWEIIVEKTKILYPLMTSEEKNRVPKILLDELPNPDDIPW